MDDPYTVYSLRTANFASTNLLLQVSQGERFLWSTDRSGCQMVHYRKAILSILENLKSNIHGVISFWAVSQLHAHDVLNAWY